MYKALHSDVTIKKSNIHGLGIFAIKAIPKDIVLGIIYKILESFSFYEYLNSISFHPPLMIITTLIFFYIRRKILLKGEKH